MELDNKVVAVCDGVVAEEDDMMAVVDDSMMVVVVAERIRLDIQLVVVYKVL